MEIPYNGSKDPTLGVEIELQIIDPSTRQYKFCAQQILELCAKRGASHVKKELNQATLEIDTEICSTAREARESLASSISILKEVGREVQFNLIGSGSHPSFLWENNRIFPNERYKRVVDKLQIVAKRVQVYGLHVHVGTPDGDTAMAICNSALPYLPHLLALSANSPFWQKNDTGLHSYRASIMNSLPFAGFPLYFRDWKAFSRYFNTLVDCNAITLIKDLYWYVRPSPGFGTVEFRICDMTPSLDETIALVAMIQCMVMWIQDDIKKHPEHRLKNEHTYWLAPENLWMAQRYGLDGQIILSNSLKRVPIREDLKRLLAILAPYSQDLGCYEELQYIKEIIRRGNGAQRQLDIFREYGNTKKVAEMLEKEFRRASTMEFNRDSSPAMA